MQLKHFLVSLMTRGWPNICYFKNYLFIRKHFISGHFIVVISNSDFFLNSVDDRLSAASSNKAGGCSAELYKKILNSILDNFVIVNSN